MTSLAGVVTSGLGQGASFMSLPWVQDAVRRSVGFTPYPGTLNIRLDAEMVAVWRGILDGHSIVLAPPPSEPCGARLVSVVVAPDVGVTEGGVACTPPRPAEAAVIVPDVTRYREELLELIAAVHLRSHLGFHDDSRVTLRLR